MRLLLYIIFLLLYKTTVAQIHTLDIGVCPALKTPEITLWLIEENKPDKISKFISNENYKPDSLALKKECLFVSSNFSSKYSSQPCFCIEKDNGLWYERTYYKMKRNKIEYLFQIYIKMQITEKEVQVLDVEFRNKHQIIKHDKEIKEQEQKWEEYVEPPQLLPSSK